MSDQVYPPAGYDEVHARARKLFGVKPAEKLREPLTLPRGFFPGADQVAKKFPCKRYFFWLGIHG